MKTREVIASSAKSTEEITKEQPVKGHQVSLIVDTRIFSPSYVDFFRKSRQRAKTT